MAESVRLNIVIKGQKDLKNVEELFRKLIKTMGGVQAATKKVQAAESDAVKEKKRAKAELEKEINLQQKLQKEIKSAIASKKTERELTIQMRRATLQANGAYRAQALQLARLESQNKGLIATHRRLWQEQGKVATQTRKTASATADARKQQKKLNDATKKTKETIKKFNAEATIMRALLKTGVRVGGAIVAWRSITGIVRTYVRQLQMAARFIVRMATETFSFLNTLERTRFAMAAIMGNASKTTEHFSSLGEAAKAYQANLGRASAFQREVLLLSTRVAGTAEELLDASQRVLAFGSRQIATDRERIILTANLVQMSKMLGLHGEKMLTEIRQIFELNRRQGQTILETMGIDIKRLRIYKDQGQLIREMNRQALAFQAASFDMANTWTQLIDAMTVFRNLIFGDDLAKPFEALKQIVIGVRDELSNFFQISRQFKMSDEEVAAAQQEGPWAAVKNPGGWREMGDKSPLGHFGWSGLMSNWKIPEEEIARLSKAVADLIVKFGDLVGVIGQEVVEGFVSLTPEIEKFTTLIEEMTKSSGGLSNVMKSAVHGYMAFLNFGKFIVAAVMSVWKQMVDFMDQVRGAAIRVSLLLDTISKKWDALSRIPAKVALQFSPNVVEDVGFSPAQIEHLKSQLEEIDERAEKTAKGLDDIKPGKAWGQVTEELKLMFEELQKIIKATDPPVLKNLDEALGEINDGLKLKGETGSPTKTLTKAQESAMRAWDKRTKQIIKQRKEMSLYGAELIRVRVEEEAGIASLGDWEISQKQRNERTAAYTDLLKKQNSETLRKRKLEEAYEFEALLQENRTMMEMLFNANEINDAKEWQLELDMRLYEASLRRMEVEDEKGRITKKYQEHEIRNMTRQLRMNKELQDDVQDHVASLEESTIDLVEIFDKSFESIESGVKGLGDVFENAGKDMVKRFAKQFLFGKKQEFDLPFKMNLEGFTGPGGIIGQLMGQGGQQGGQSFGSNFFNAVGKFFGGSGGGGGMGGGGSSPGGMVFKQGTGWVQRAMGGGAGGMGGVGSWGGGTFGAAGLTRNVVNSQGVSNAGPGFMSKAFPGGYQGQGGGFTAGMGAGAVSGLASLAGYKGIGGHIGSTIGAMAMSVGVVSKFATQAISQALGVTFAAAGQLANFIVPGLGFLVGFGMEKLLGALMKPGRIKTDKKEIRAFAKEIGLEGVDPQGGKSLTVRHQQADVEFAGQQGGLSALSLMYVDLDDKISHVFGTMKRFTNQFQVGFLEAGLTMEEANQKVLELAEKMGFQIETVVKHINKFATETSLADFNEELAETATSGNEMLFLADMLEGAIQIATKFNPLIDATALSNRYLADAFAEAAEKAGVTEEKITSLGDRIRSGDLDVEKAIGELHDIGITSLDIKNIKLDEKQIKEELERAMEQSATAIKGMQSAFAAGIAAGLKGGDVAAAAEAGFKDVFRKALQEKAMADFIEENMKDWFDGFDFTQPIDMSSDAFQNLASEIGIAADQLYDLLEAAGLLPDTIAAGDKNLQAMNDSLAQVKQSIIDTQISFAANLVAIGAMNAVDLQQMKHSRTSGQLQMHRDFNLHEGGVWNALESTEQGLRAWVQAFANMRQAEVDMFLARAAEEQRYTQDVIDGINERKEADLEANTLNIEAANKRLESLREERTEISDIAKEAKALATGFQSSADKIEGMIRKIATGSDAFSVGEQLGFLQREEALLRQQLIGAEDEDQPGLFNKLSANLVAQLEMSRNQGTELTDETNATLQELERIQGEALAGATLQRSIEEAMELELRSIDGRIQEQTDLITFYQKQANLINELAGDAVEAAQDRATAAIDAMRRDTVDRLTKLYDDEMHVWHGIALHMKEGTDMDTLLLDVLKRLDETIGDLNTTLGGIPGHAAGFSGMVSRPSLMQVAERGPEYVEVTPSGSVPGPLHLTVAPTINVSGGANGRAVGQQVYRQIEDGIIRSMESGRLRGVLKKGH